MKNNNIPKEWIRVTLGDISKKIVDGMHHTPKYTESGIAFISVKDIYNNKIHFDKFKYISLEEHKSLIKRCNPEIGDVLITKSGTIGRLAIVKSEKDFSLFVSVALIKNYINSIFLLRSLKNHINEINICQVIKGGVIKNYHLEDLRIVEIALPPLSEQNEIVNRIESLPSNLDAGVEALKKQKSKFSTQ